ncbi:heterokaryon incompatibility protein [Stagonosporopsis vannaccii]|nr:heterokaryon incompatibility protein [Stagonosporopsis vannaccii]
MVIWISTTPATPLLALEQDTLCKYCELVVFGKQTWISIWRMASGLSEDRTSLSHDFTRQQLQASVTGGCRFCHFLLSKVPPDCYGETLRVGFALSAPEGVNPRKINHVAVHVSGLPQYAQRVLHLGVFSKPMRAGSIASILVRPADSLNVVRPNFDPGLARSWIESCGSLHKSKTCRNVPRQLPTRVLDVSAFESGLIPLRTIPTGMVDPYSALSYCWGKSKPLMTTKATLDSHRKGLQLHDMPKTYRDAIFVTFKLNIKYLWIDALCIIQDCDTDKIGELSSMKNYYENAHVMIAASGANSSDAGFLNFNVQLNTNTSVVSHGYRLEQKSSSFGIPCFTLSGLEDRIYLDTAPETYEAHKEPLNERAWTYQEWLLCRRALVFPANGGFFLHCNEEKRHDDLIDFGGPFACSQMFLPPSSMLTTGDSNEVTIIKAWLMHTREYSERLVTFEADRAVAIAGVAEAYSIRAGAQLGDYVAGHWSKHLMMSLHWRVYPSDAKKAMHPVRPNSWSWFSVRGPIQLQPFVMIMQQHMDLGKVRNFTVRRVSEDLPFGAVDSGRITIQACLSKAIWVPPGSGSKLPSLRAVQTLSDLGAYTFADTLDDTPVKPTPVVLLPLCVAGHQTINGLLVQRTNAIDDNVFRRVGYFEGIASTFLGTCTSVRLVHIV